MRTSAWTLFLRRQGASDRKRNEGEAEEWWENASSDGDFREDDEELEGESRGREAFDVPRETAARHARKRKRDNASGDMREIVAMVMKVSTMMLHGIS